MVLRHRDFALLWGGQLVSQLGNHFNYVALAWLVLQATGSTLAMGGVLLAQVLPNALLGWVAGVAVDRMPQRKLMVGCDWLRMLLVLSLPLTHLWGRLPLAAIYGVTFLTSAASVLFYAAEKTVIPLLVPPGELTEANAYAEMTSQAAGLAGPVLAGMVVAWLAYPVDALYFDAASFGVSALCLMAAAWQDRPLRVPTSIGQVWIEAVEGVRFLATHRFLLGVSLTAVGVNFLVVPYSVVFPVLSDQVLHAGAIGFGWLIGGFGGGMLAGSLTAAAIARRLPPTTIVYGGMALVGACFATMSALPRLWPDVLLAVLAGLGVSPANAVILTLVQQITPEAMQGRVFASGFALVGMASPLGVAVAAVFLGSVGPRAVLLGMGVLTMAAAAGGRIALGSRHDGSISLE